MTGVQTCALPISLRKLKIILLGVSTTLLLASSYFVAVDYYNKPIFLALLAGGLYIPISGLVGFFEPLFKSTNNFRTPLFKEIIFQILRLVSVPIIILLFIDRVSSSILIFLILLTICFSYFVSLAFLFFASRKQISFIKHREEKLNDKDKKELKKFIIPLSVMALSGAFFGYIGMVMLGHFVQIGRASCRERV